MINIVIFTVGILIAGFGHWMRDTYSFQHGETLWLRWYRKWPWWIVEKVNGSMNGWRDYWHRVDSLMRFGCAMIGGASVSMPVRWFFVPAFFFGGLFAAEWLFSILYHVIGVPAGHPDKRTLWQQIKILLGGKTK